METDYQPADPSPDIKFFDKRCATYFCGCTCTDIALLLLAIPFVVVVAPVGLIMAALAPGAAILYFSYRYYREYVTVGQMVVCCIEIILWMVPLLIWDLIWVLAISPEMRQKGLCSICVLAYAIQSYFFAGFCEELIKYFTINRLQDSMMTIDWRSFVVYGVCAGCGFAMAENILYTLASGYGTAIVRAFSAVPFHCTTGCILGIWVAKRRHLGLDVPWWKAMLIPWLLHGTYDFILMVGEASGSDVGILGVIGIIFLIIGGLCYARHEAMQLSLQGNVDGSKYQNIHDAIVHRDEATGEFQTRVLGHPRIAMWCKTTQCVCDCCFTLWCGCCKSSSLSLPPPSDYSSSSQSHDAISHIGSPVHAGERPNRHDTRGAQSTGIPVFGDPTASHTV